MTVALNSLVIIAIWKDPFKELKGSANYLILNLAICDLLVGFPGELLLGLLHWFPNNNVTLTAYTIMCLGFYASMFTILGLAVERLIAISCPLNSADYLRPSYLKLGIISIWIFAGLMAFIMIMAWSSLHIYELYIVDSIGIVIMLSLLACYTRIYLLVRKTSYLDITASEEKKSEGICLTENAREIEKLKRKERRVALSVFILVGIFAVCWIPAIILENINAFCSSYHYRLHVVKPLVLLHPLLNPIAYSLRTVKYRKALQGLFHRSPTRRQVSPKRAIV